MIIDLGTKLLLLDDSLLLVLTRLARLLGGLLLELAVVHDFADRRFSVRGNLDKVQIGIVGKPACIFDTNDAYLLATGADEADLGYPNALINSSFSADCLLLKLQ